MCVAHCVLYRSLYRIILYLAVLYTLQASEILRFELDDKKLSELLTQVADIEKAMENYAHT